MEFSTQTKWLARSSVCKCRASDPSPAQQLCWDNWSLHSRKAVSFQNHVVFSRKLNLPYECLTPTNMSPVQFNGHSFNWVGQRLLTGLAEGRWFGQSGDPACHFELWASDRKKQGQFEIHSKKGPPSASSRIPCLRGCQRRCGSGSGRAGRGVLARISLQHGLGCGSCCWTCLHSCQFTANKRASSCAASGSAGWGGGEQLPCLHNEPWQTRRAYLCTARCCQHCSNELSYVWKGKGNIPSFPHVCL